jgi:hypothetical protein
MKIYLPGTRGAEISHPPFTIYSKEINFLLFTGYKVMKYGTFMMGAA